MKLLLDTHSFLWFIEDNPNLSTTALAPIKDATNEIFFSIASVWEIAIKISVGKIRLKEPLEAFIQDQLNLNRITLLGIKISHAATVAALPLHHRDPFDRLLVAQAIVEQVPIISKDAALDAYGITRVW